MIIFDLDGTLWDSSKSVAESWNYETARQGYDCHFTVEDMRRIMGLTMNAIADALLPEMDEAERYPLFRKCESYEVEFISEHGGELFPYVRETLIKLKNAGYDMSIVSNCQAGYIEAFLKSMDMWDFFSDYEEWGNTGLSKAMNIRLVMERNHVTDAVYVGDIQKDADAAVEAGIPCISAEYGFGHIEDPIARLYSFDQLEDILKELKC